MLRAIRLFFRTREANHFLVLSCLLLATLAEAIGIGTLLPVIAVAAGVESPGSAQIAGVLKTVLAFLGLPFTLGVLVSLVAFFIILRAAFTFLALTYVARTGARVSLSIRRRLVNAIFAARWGFFSDQRAGTVANAMGWETTRAGDAFVSSAEVVVAMVQVVAYAMLALFVDWKLALMGVATGVLLFLGFSGLVTTARKAAYRQSDQTTLMSSFVVDALANIKPLKSMHRFEATLRSLDSLFSKLRRAVVIREMARVGLSQGSAAIVIIVAAVGIYFANAVLSVPFPELLVSALIFNQLVNVMQKLQKLVQSAATLESAQVRTLELIEDAEAAVEPNPGRLTPNADTGCRFESVEFSHGDRRILRSVSLAFPAQKITVLGGPSGSGKTTLIDLLIGLHKPFAGEIFIGKDKISDIDIAAWRKQIGYVPQELNLFHGSVRMNLTLGEADIPDTELNAALAQAGASDFIAALPNGLDTDIGEMGSKLSGGQRQRISLARALLNKPKVLILDEVTSALDPVIESEIIANVAALRGGYTIIAITHRPSWRNIADRIYAVSDGTVREEPSPKKKPKLRAGA